MENKVRFNFWVIDSDPQIEQDVWLNDPVKFSHENETYIIYSAEKSWQESYQFCKERGSSLAIIEDMNATNVIIEAMGDHPKGRKKKRNYMNEKKKFSNKKNPKK